MWTEKVNELNNVPLTPFSPAAKRGSSNTSDLLSLTQNPVLQYTSAISTRIAIGKKPCLRPFYVSNDGSLACN